MRSVVVPENVSQSIRRGYAQILAVHAALLHNGKIVYFSGDQHDPGRNAIGDFDYTRLFDCSTLAVSAPPAAPSIRDLFCCGHAFLADGRLLVGGGTQGWSGEQIDGGDPHGHAGAGHFRGTRECYTFDPGGGHWQDAAAMVREPGFSTGGGRWYPTLITLGNGNVLAVSGHPSDADHRHYNNTIETYAPGGSGGSWTDVGVLPGTMAGYDDLTFYPRCHLLKNGKVFFSSSINGQSMVWDTSSHAWAPVCPGVSSGAYSNSIAANSVLLPLLHEDGYRQRVLACGDVIARRIDLDASTPAWQATSPRTLTINGNAPVRTHCNSVLLPTGEVVTTGGMRDQGNDPGSAVLNVEVYRHQTDTWITLPSTANTSIARNYHSVALLMPDGRVWMCGSNIRASWSFHEPGNYPGTLPNNAQDGITDNRHLEIELFEPWYYGRPDRPDIAVQTPAVSVGGSFNIGTQRAATVSRVAVIRVGSSTHSFNPDQRYVGLPFTRSNGSLNVQLPDNENLLPPGYYLVYILDQVVDPVTSAVLDVPSIGQFLRIDNGKIFKELKWEIKELKFELKDNIKRELDLVWKLEIETIPPKSPKENVENPFGKHEWRFDPIAMQEQLAKLALHIDNMNRKAGTAKPFIKMAERPAVGQPAMQAAAERTPPPSKEEMVLFQHHGGHGGDHGADHNKDKDDHHGHHDGDGKKPKDEPRGPKAK